MDVLSWRLRSHQLCFEGLSVMLGAPWGSKGRSAAAAPWLPPAIWQKTLNKVSNVGRGFIPIKVSKLAIKTISQGDTTFWAKAQPTNYTRQQT
ncbi:MAG: hypothetical protein ACJAVX_002759 [Pseudoalteromonas rhizosphaerae]|jgi:hypothetical protein|uniref:Uncharacterized protein n=1 Tax=Pseudoalteromonas neustonica TaxID=1840331 RepID=A0ABY3F8T8_9GAMM|nr:MULTISPECIES: hypothetical protein [Pseudoalteromonas]MBB1292562.1 hypothetical protein [Pseudoalteromonas sp. SR41-4]MBB1507926.1 hypothetical protein [Pseudoalteromonas sp. SG41-1]TVU80419.1 hypothetical protein FQP85_19860 [Pseudoalteromonas neustonica]